MGRPKWTSTGWKPASARFKDSITESNVNVLIDHVLVSANLPVSGNSPGKVWNPYEQDDLKSHRAEFKEASDHFLVTLDLSF